MTFTLSTTYRGRKAARIADRMCNATMRSDIWAGAIAFVAAFTFLLVLL